MDERATIAKIYRRVGFGMVPGQLDELEAVGVAGVIDRLVDPSAAGVPSNPDPWKGLEFHSPFDEKGADIEGRAEDRRNSVKAWVAAMVSAPRPLEEWMRWFWHGHLVSSLGDVQDAKLLVRQLRLYGSLGLGNFRDLLYETTIDPAMLIYLDGRGSKKAAPNENYSRELLELFALGIGSYTEDDVQAGAAALTGWRIPLATGEAIFDPRIHDDSTQTYLGVEGVHDVDTVIDAVVAHESCAPWIARSIAEGILGVGVDEGLIAELAEGFRIEGLELRPLVRRVLEAGADGAFQPMIVRPVPWIIAAMKSLQTSATLGGRGDPLTQAFRSMGQVPMAPPNVSGWPGDSAWVTSSATVGRFNTAGLLAGFAPADAEAVAQASSHDLDALAATLGIPDGFSEATATALNSLQGSGPAEVLTLALASPDLAQA